MSCIKNPVALGGLALALALAWTGTSEAAQNVYLTLTVNETAIEGDSSVSSDGRGNDIECYSWDHHLFWPVDPATGSLTGKRQHRPVKITKSVDKSSPLLFQALANNENVNTARFRFYRPDPATGDEQHYYTILLENGRISRITTLSPDTLEAGNAAQPVKETVSFTYQKITWTYEPTGVSHEDDWQVPGP